MPKKKLPNPGSDEAVKLGCVCGTMDNHRGRGIDDKGELFSINGECPLHGHIVPPTQIPVKKPEPPGLRKKIPAKERVIRAALRAMEYPELAADFDAMRLEDIVAGAEHNAFGDTLIGFVVLELNECLEEKWSFNKCADEAWQAIEKATEDLSRAASAVELLQIEIQQKRNWRGVKRAQKS